MASEEGLKVLLQGDASSLVSAAKEGKAAMTDAAKGIESAGSRIVSTAQSAIGDFKLFGDAAKDVADALGDTGAAIDRTSGKFVLLNKSLLGSSAEMKAFATNAKLGTIGYDGFGVSAGKAVKSTQDFTKATVNGNGALSGFTNILRDAPYGIQGVGNNITQLTDSFAQLRVQTGSAGGALAAMASSIFSPAGLISVGLSAAISLWTVYAQRQQQAASEAKKFKEENKSLADILNESAASVQGQIETAKQLGAIITDTNKSYEQRKSALNELQKISKEYFNGLSLEKTSYEQIKTAIDKYSDSLVRAATIKGLQDQIGKTAEAIAKQAPIIAAGTKELAKKDNPFAEFVKDTAKETDTANVQLQGAFTRLDSMLTASGRKMAADIGNVGAQQQQAISKIAPLDELKQRLQGLVSALSEALSGTDTPDKKSIKDTKTVTDVLQELDKELVKIDAQFAVTGGALEDLSKNKIAVFKKAIGELAELNVLPGSDIVNGLQQRVEALQSTFEKTPVTVKIPISIDPLPNIETSKITGLSDSFNKVFNQENGRLVIGVEQIKETLTQSFSGLGEALAGALSGGGLDSVVLGIGSLISDVLQKVGQDMIKLGVAMLAIKKGLTLSFSNPALAIAAGVAAIAAASLIKSSTQSSIQKNVPHFATGGAVTKGATLAVVGDNPSGIEYMIPKELMDRLRGNNGLSGTLTARVAGRDLEFVLDTAEEFDSRIGG